VYNYTDHLGNIRLSYTQSGTELKILEENHYYPFGLKHSNYNADKKQWSKFELVAHEPHNELVAHVENVTSKTVLKEVVSIEYKYKYNGKEYQDELGLNVYDYGWRNYMPDIGRWNKIDPLFNDLKFANDNSQMEDDDDQDKIYMAIINDLELGGGIYNTDNLNPYGYGYNNPVSFDDPDGRCPACWGALIGAGVDTALQMATNAATGKDVTDIKWGQVAVSAGAGALSGGISSLSKIKSLGALAKVRVEIATDTGISVGSQAINDGKVSLTKKAIDIGAGQLVGRGVGNVVEKKVVNSAKGKQLQANINREKNVARGKSNTVPKNKADVNTAKKKLDAYVNKRSSASSATASGAASTTVEKIDEKRKKK
jgi:RHS repeat-associated protein